MAHYQQAVVVYGGDNTIDRLIATPFPLDSGAVAIWIFEYKGTSVTHNPKFRHNDPLMPDTCTVGNSGTSVGITAFTAEGFVISHQTTQGALGSVNGLGFSYAALVMRDSAPGGEILRVGTYAGSLSHSRQFQVPEFGPFTQITENTFTAADVGATFTAAASPGGLIFTLTSWSGPNAASMYPAWDGIYTGQTHTAITRVDNRVIVVGDADWIPTHVWVWGRGVTYRSDDFTGDSSMALSGESKPVTNQIQGFVVAGDVAGFEIGTDNNVNGSSLTYYWLACRFSPAILARNFFRSFRITPTAAATDQVTGLGFTPLVAIAMRYGAAARYRRQPQHTGTQSSVMDGSLNAVGGIDAMGVGTLDLGEDVAAVGADVYGFAFAPADFDTSPPGLPAGCPVAFSVPLTSQPGSCPLVDFPH